MKLFQTKCREPGQSGSFLRHHFRSGGNPDRPDDVGGTTRSGVPGLKLLSGNRGARCRHESPQVRHLSVEEETELSSGEILLNATKAAYCDHGYCYQPLTGIRINAISRLL